MKVLMVILIAVLFCACALEGVNVIGPAGGFVFYDKGNYSDGWRYLECAPVDAGQVDMDNRSYTYDFVEIKKFCDDFLYNGYDDWRLPNDSELYTMLNAYEKQFKRNSYSIEYYYVSSEKTTYRISSFGEVIKASSFFSQPKFIARPVRQF